MRLVILFAALFFLPITWQGNFDNALTEAAKTNKLILINFSGSDWCGPCIRLRKEIFETSEFENYAKDNLILIRADFPRQRKNQLRNAQIKLNETLADKYNPEGKFPFTLLVDKTGKVMRSWDGYSNETITAFLNQIYPIVNASR